MSFWEMMEDVKTGEVVPVIKVGIDRTADASRNMIVQGTVRVDGVDMLKAEVVHPGRTVPINGRSGVES